jgi:N-acetylglutamate synthase-like GNAT family acetyltransferase
MAKSTDTLLIAPSDDHAAAWALAKAAHLEVAETPEQPLAMWGAFADGRMVGTISLDTYGGLPVVGRIAVSQGYRGSGLGGRLLDALEGEARRRGLTELWATARAPGFFVAMGYSVVAEGRERDLLLSECLTCGQYATECQPQAVRRMFVPCVSRRRANDEPRAL